MHIHTSSKKHQKSPFFGPLKIPPKIPPFFDPPRPPKIAKPQDCKFRQISHNFAQNVHICTPPISPILHFSPTLNHPEPHGYTPRQNPSFGTRWNTPQNTGVLIRDALCTHVCTLVHPKYPRNCTLINSSFGTRWNPYFRTPPIRDALEYTQNGGCVKTREFGTPPNTPQNTRIYNPTHSGRHVGTHSHKFTHNHTQTHTTTHKKIFFHKNSHEHTTFHTHTHTECVSTLHSRAVPHR